MKKLFGLLAISGAVAAALFFVTSLSGTMGERAAAVAFTQGESIREGSLVTLEYTLKDESGAVLESNAGKEPMSYIHGAGQIVPGLERELAGLKPGDQKTVTVKPEDGYGPIDPELVQELPKEKFPAEALKPGATFMMQTPQGPIPIRVKQIKEKTVLVDLNNPLAGKTLTFEITVKDIREPARP